MLRPAVTSPGPSTALTRLQLQGKAGDRQPCSETTEYSRKAAGTTKEGPRQRGRVGRIQETRVKRTLVVDGELNVQVILFL